MKKLLIRAIVWLGNLHRRALAFFFFLIGPRLAYRLTGWGASLMYCLLDLLRVRSEAQCRAALQSRVPAEEIPRIAEKSFINRARNLTDLMLAPYLLRPKTYERYGGRIPEPHRQELLDGQHRRQPTILLTAYYGSFDLLPIFLGYNGIHAAVVYRAHENEGFDSYRRKIRSQSGSELIPLQVAAIRLEQVLSTGGTVAILADHHVEERGMPVTFLGISTKVSRSIGLLAWRYEANVVVSAIRRLNNTFQFEIVLAEVIYYREAAGHADPVTFITHRYLRALEEIILKDPTQYLWAHARWGEEYSRRVTAPTESAQENPGV
ncbi:MAG: lysophospholipid acyltransferase family protein [Planctomycetes bacterium]|nr:lysophospholipid acyltransferase family protein [Planctomycetota bacterium]MBI3835092.1 lysophospholipid acyltransferase family protein [Planctomycetota bacterium]